MNLDGQLQQIIDELLSHGISLDLAKKEFEKKYIVGAVKRSSGNLGRAAVSLGIHRNTLRNKAGIGAQVRVLLHGAENENNQFRLRLHNGHALQ